MINFEDFSNWALRFTSRFNLEVFIGGKITNEEAKEILAQFLSKIKFQKVHCIHLIT